MIILRLLCRLGIHWSGRTDRFLCGDGMSCDICGVEKYPEVFPGIILFPRKSI